MNKRRRYTQNRFVETEGSDGRNRLRHLQAVLVRMMVDNDLGEKELRRLEGSQSQRSSHSMGDTNFVYYRMRNEHELWELARKGS